MNLPAKFAWLEAETAPKALIEALRHYGTLEHAGKGSNPDIIAWAKEIGVNKFYIDDDIPWCGLFVGVVMKRSGYSIPLNLQSLGARNWLDWGNKIPLDGAMLWDVLVFSRPGGGHVGFYVGENKDNFLVYGGNQSNKVGFAFVAKTRCVGVRRSQWAIGQPANIRKINLSFEGEVSHNEA